MDKKNQKSSKNPKKELSNESPPKSSDAQDPNFYHGTNEFLLENGDQYVGEYMAHRNGQIWREGRGFYLTHDGQIYEGIWRDDQLVEDMPMNITYNNGTIFEGTTIKNKYEKCGTMQFSDGFKMYANFAANKPVGEFCISDMEGRLWFGTSDASKDKIFCRPENLFFKNIHEDRGKKKDILMMRQPQWKELARVSLATIKDSSLENSSRSRIFAKNDLIPSGVDFNDSPWIKNYQRYMQKRSAIMEKLSKRKSLSSDEKKWFMNSALAKRERQQLKLDHKDGKDKMKDHQMGIELLDRFFSKEHAERNKAVSVIYPSYNWVVQEESIEEETEPSTETKSSSSSEEPEEAEKLETSDKEFETTKEDEEEEEEEVPLSNLDCQIKKPVQISMACSADSLFDYVNERLGTNITFRCANDDGISLGNL